MKCSFLNLYVNNMAAFDWIRLLRLKKYILCTLLILKRIKFTKQRKERKCWVRKIYLDRPDISSDCLLIIWIAFVNIQLKDRKNRNGPSTSALLKRSFSNFRIPKNRNLQQQSFKIKAKSFLEAATGGVL